MPGRLPLCRGSQSGGRPVFSPALEGRIADAIEKRIDGIANKLEERTLAIADKLGERMQERAVSIADSAVRTSIKAGASELRTESAIEWERIKAGTPAWVVPAIAAVVAFLLLR